MQREQISFSLSSEIVAMLEAKVRSGKYGSESEIVEEALLALAAKDQAIEDWLRDEVVPAYDALQADASRARTPTQVRETLAQMAGRARQQS